MTEVPIREESPDMPDAGERTDWLLRWLTGRPFATMKREGLWHPTIDVHNREEDIVVEAELPGMKGEDVDVSVEEGHLLIRGSRPPSPLQEEGETYYRERPVGKFHRVIHLPVDVDREEAEATYEDGVLTVTLPKVKRERPRKIEIR